MRFGAGRGSHQIVEVGGEEGRQVPTGAQLLGAFEEVGRLGHEELTLRDEGEGGGSGEAGVQDWDEVERPSPGLGDHPRILPTVLLMTDSGRETEEQVEKGAHYPIKLSYSCQCKGTMKKKLWRNLGVSPIS